MIYVKKKVPPSTRTVMITIKSRTRRSLAIVTLKVKSRNNVENSMSLTVFDVGNRKFLRKFPTIHMN